MSAPVIRIGGASGYWGESDLAWSQFFGGDDLSLDFVVFDYLAEITMSLLARMRARDPSAGYAPDFVARLSAHLPVIAARGVRIVSNAGGVNPEGCAAAVRAAIAEAGLELSVSVVTGDDLMDRLHVLDGAVEMFSGEPLPDQSRIVSANAYLGAFPVAAALDGGADIVITGRGVDSAVTLGPLIHAFGWRREDLDRLAQGSLVGHLLECGPQVTGGNFTDWRALADGLVKIGYPVAEVAQDGTAVITKPPGTGGAVDRGTVAEQMLYEIGDPYEYILPDVVCDFSRVKIEAVGPDRVRVSGARGRGVPEQYKASVTVRDGYRLSALFFMVGSDAPAKARIVFDAALARARAKLRAAGLPDYTHTELEITGDGSAFGESRPADDIAFRISVRHEASEPCALVLREASGFGLATPPGLSLFSGSRPKPQAVVRLWSGRVARGALDVRVNGELFPSQNSRGREIRALRQRHDLSRRAFARAIGYAGNDNTISKAVLLVEQGQRGFGRAIQAGYESFKREAGLYDLLPAERAVPPAPSTPGALSVPLEQLAWLRAGDKGDHANIGVIARRSEDMPYIWAALTEERVREYLGHVVRGEVRRWYLPGCVGMNILLENALGGGGMASLRNDSQGKGFGQVLGAMVIPAPGSSP